MNNEFKNIVNTNPERRSSFGFKNKVLVPFFSGVLLNHPLPSRFWRLNEEQILYIARDK